MNNLPSVIYVYRDLNGTLMTAEHVDDIPDRKLGDPIGIYDFRTTKTFQVQRGLHEVAGVTPHGVIP